MSLISNTCPCCDPDVLAVAADHDQMMYGDLLAMSQGELLNAAIQMRELLHAVNEATGPGANEWQLPDALKDIGEYIDSIPR